MQIGLAQGANTFRQEQILTLAVADLFEAEPFSMPEPDLVAGVETGIPKPLAKEHHLGRDTVGIIMVAGYRQKHFGVKLQGYDLPSAVRNAGSSRT